jgi:hypothetical protein
MSYTHKVELMKNRVELEWNSKKMVYMTSVIVIVNTRKIRS